MEVAKNIKLSVVSSCSDEVGTLPDLANCDSDVLLDIKCLINRIQDEEIRDNMLRKWEEAVEINNR